MGCWKYSVQAAKDLISKANEIAWKRDSQQYGHSVVCVLAFNLEDMVNNAFWFHVALIMTKLESVITDVHQFKLTKHSLKEWSHEGHIFSERRTTSLFATLSSSSASVSKISIHGTLGAPLEYVNSGAEVTNVDISRLNDSHKLEVCTIVFSAPVFAVCGRKDFDYRSLKANGE